MRTRAWYLTLAGALFLCAPRCGLAGVTDVDGFQSGEFEFRWSTTYEITGAYTQHRFALPTAGNFRTWGYFFEPQWTEIAVVDSLGHDATWQDALPYNTGQLNSGHWINVLNPHQGSKFVYRVELTVHAQTASTSYGVKHQVCNWGVATVDYTNASYFVYLFDPALESALSSTLSQYPTGPQPGVRGDLERIAMCIQGFVFQSPAAGLSPRTSHAVLLDGYGDCDDLVKVQCALQRQYGVPSRCALTGNMDVGNPGLFLPGPLSLHAFGEYWTGSEWEAYEAHATTNFPTAAQVVWGIAEDFTEIYPAYNTQADPFLQGPTSFAGSFVSSDYGSYSQLENRFFGPGTQFAQPAGSLEPCTTDTPADAIAPIGHTLDVPGPRRGRGPFLRLGVPESPARGTIHYLLSLPVASQVEIRLTDIAGRDRGRVFSGRLGPGTNRGAFADDDLRPGVYFLRVSTAIGMAAGKFVYLGR